jgi:DNA-binding response OmpR family regulator
MAKIVFIEDEAQIRQDIAETLELAGHQVIQAANGVQGLAAILSEQPDLTISDISMPEMNGHELLCEIRENHPALGDMPIMFLTARADREDQIVGRSLGADEYLTKPVDFELMLAAINSRLRLVQRMHQRQFHMLVTLCRAISGVQESSGERECGADADIESVYALLDAQGHSARHLLRLISKGMPH